MFRILTATILFILAGVDYGYAQLYELPLSENPQAAYPERLAGARVLGETDTLELPFFDDFSGTLLTPDFNKWQFANKACSDFKKYMSWRLLDTCTSFVLHETLIRTDTSAACFVFTADTLPGDEYALAITDTCSGTSYFTDTVAFGLKGDSCYLYVPRAFDSCMAYSYNLGGVWINNTAAIRPPNLNVATFDGLNSAGAPYYFISPNSDATTPNDTLTSRSINLLPYTPADSLYLSFQWQPGGRMDFPDLSGPGGGDSLVVFFKKKTGEWISVLTILPTETMNDVFYTATVGVKDTSFFGSAFQFRFVNHGLGAGTFDAYHIDVVYLDTNRNADNRVRFSDRSFGEAPVSLLQPYTSMPVKHFMTNPAAYIFPQPSSVLKNFGNAAFKQEFADASVYDRQKNLLGEFYLREPGELITLIGTGATQTITGSFTADSLPDLSGKNFATIRSRFIVEGDVPVLTTENFNATVDTLVYIDTLQEGIYLASIQDKVTLIEKSKAKVIDFTLNDTLNFETRFDAYFAYDDGSAESALRLNQNEGHMGVIFDLPLADTLYGITLYFARSEVNISGRPLIIKVWSQKGTTPFEFNIYEQQAGLLYPVGQPGFYYYPFTAPVILQPGEFIIGLQQKYSGLLTFGLDKNTNSVNKTLYEVTGSWEEAEGFEGSVMMRPVFQKDYVVGLSQNVAVQSSAIIYPNPASESITCNEAFTSAQVFSLSGQEVRSVDFDSPVTKLDLFSLPSGFWIVRLQHASRTSTHKLIIQK